MAKAIQSAKKVKDEYTNTELNEYRVTYTDGVLSTVPKTTQNKDYRQLLAWVEAGNTIAEAD